ncbi:response regulator [Schlegelella sp. ID0723]|uniref:histidine kinase n=2 Tax=Piscinibacter koreensis TaxID=2742824 RepID=A0A7Y6NPA1_9BURK|nr:response regulator [Schlegelella koreensis]
MPATLVGMIAGVGIVALLFWRVTPMPVMGAWLGAFAVLWLGRLFMLLRYRRAVAGGRPNWRGWLRIWNAATLTSAFLWGMTAIAFYSRGSGVQQTGLIIVIYSYCIAAVPVLANQARVFLAFGVLCFGPMIVRIASDGDIGSMQLAAELLLIVSLISVLAGSYRQAFQRVTEEKLRADGLLDALRVEKQAADAARHEAEVANRAKTQFFTAASHDLRQPLHAMGLFAEALRQRTHEPEVAQLVNSINESVDALEQLFSQLLDITRIDTGGVDVKPQHFVVGDIFRKLRLHYEPEAFDKGLELRLRGGRHAIHADPLLVERVLRNLVSNAIRYTTDGSVLVTCRRRGERVRLQVWDTGPGIRAEDRKRVFEEFYQVPNATAPAPDERKGLGLGLAIVKRLAGLMGAPLDLRSEPGRGSVFTLELPVGEPPRERADAVASKAPAGVTLAGTTIIIVEDEPAVREGLEVLLRGWGADVLAFDSVAATRAWAGDDAPSAAAGAIKPALLIVDYRLEAGQTGVDAINLLRRRFGAQVPAIVVTGSSMTGHEKEAAEHDFHVLIKPVLPNKLRAMIAFKLAGR